jgi:cytochrome c-type biogenesis protein CcmH
MSIGLAVALVGLTSLAMALLLVPLLVRRQRAESRDAYNLAVYRDQLAEIERDLARGVLTTEQADAARTEIGRRILALSPAAAAPAPSSMMPYAAATAAVLLLPFAAWALYAVLGSPAMPDQPYASRGTSPAPAAAENAEQGAPHVDMAQAVQQLTAHLKDHPDDLTGWVLLGRSDMSLGRYQDAADAYKHAVDLSGKRADILGDWGEALVLAASGTITPAAKEAFEAGLKDPELAPRSRYYLALAQMQQGDAKGAVQAWVDLEADSPADADWLPMVRKRIEQSSASLGVDPASLKTSAGTDRPKVAAAAPPPGHPPMTAPATAPSAASGAIQPGHPPTPASAAAPSAATGTATAGSAPDPQKVREAQQALAGASPQDRQAMINSMVERLAARLEQQPDDVDGWTRLGRSYNVLNQPDKARDAYARAVKLRPDDIGLKQGYAEAIIAAAGDDATAPPSEATALFRQILQAEPKNQMALWYVGIAEADAGHKDSARDLWSRLLAELPANAPGRQEVEQRLAALKQDATK